MGLQEMLAEIQKEYEQDNEEIIKKAKMEADKLIVKKVEELDRKYAKQREIFETKLKQMKTKLTAKAELDTYREKEKKEFELIEKLINESFNDVVQHLRTHPEIYFKFLKNLIFAAQKEIGIKPLGVSFSKEEEDIIKDFKKELSENEVKILSPSNIKGGVICSAGENYIDFSIENIFRTLRPEILKIVTKAISHKL